MLILKLKKAKLVINSLIAFYLGYAKLKSINGKCKNYKALEGHFQDLTQREILFCFFLLFILFIIKDVVMEKL